MTDERIAGLDVGTVRIGVAISDPTGRMAHPRETVAARPLAAAVDRVAAILAEAQIRRVVVGLPIDLDGKAGRAVRMVRLFTRALVERTGVEVVEWDERLTSVAAERMLVGADLSRARRRQVVDQVAAAMILQGWLDNAQRRGGRT
jgi:putative Holliday junction resolvase